MAILLLVTSMAGCSGDGPGKDTDGDDLSDAQERQGWSIIVETMTNRERIHVTSDPVLRDTDEDGISDADEYLLGTDPRAADTDGDGLTDCQEAVHSNRTECEDATFRGETDGGYGTNPTRADSDPGPSRFKRGQPWTDFVDGLQAQWGDGVSDGMEALGYEIQAPQGTRFVTTDPRSVDTDGDGLEDGEEIFLYDSDPVVSDTDGDGCLDGEDAWPDRHEEYRPGLQSITLHESPDADGADLRLRILLGDIDVTLGGTEGIQLKPGFNDLSPYDPEPSGFFRCLVGPADPWTKVQAVAVDVDGDQIESIDIWSISASKYGLSPQSPGFSWNVRTGEIGSQRGVPIAEEAVFEGTMATLVMTPQQMVE